MTNETSGDILGAIKDLPTERVYRKIRGTTMNYVLVIVAIMLLALNVLLIPVPARSNDCNSVTIYGDDGPKVCIACRDGLGIVSIYCP